MRILIANDDGIYSPGIAALAEVAAKFGEVRVVAPDVEQSSASHAITASRPLSYKRTPIGNFPDEEPKGLLWTRQSITHYDGKVVPGEDPMGRKHFWFTVIPVEQMEEGTDRWAVEHGYVSMTPLRLDLTNEQELRAAQLRHPLG